MNRDVPQVCRLTTFGWLSRSQRQVAQDCMEFLEGLPLETLRGRNTELTTQLLAVLKNPDSKASKTILRDLLLEEVPLVKPSPLPPLVSHSATPCAGSRFNNCNPLWGTTA